MKPNVAKQHPYTGDYYSYVLVTSADGTVTEKQYVTFPSQFKMSIEIDFLSNLLITSDAKLQIYTILRNIVDKNGEEIYEGGVWEIYQTAPLLSALGTKEGYQYKARIIAGDE